MVFTPPEPPIIYGPIVHLTRHAESENKLYLPGGINEAFCRSLVDPMLTKNGRTGECVPFDRAHKIDQAYITHIYSSPLSRALETACLAFPDVVASGVKVEAFAELQSMDPSSNGTGMNVEDLKKTFDKRNMAVLALDWYKGKGGLAKGGVTTEKDTKEETALKYLKGKVDVSRVDADWNKQEEMMSGRWSSQDFRWRIDKLKWRLERLCVWSGTNNKDEVVFMTHGSVLHLFYDLEGIDERDFHDTMAMRSFAFVVNEDGSFKEWKELNEEELMALRKQRWSFGRWWLMERISKYRKWWSELDSYVECRRN